MSEKIGEEILIKSKSLPKPFALNVYYPTKFSQLRTKIYNGIFNQLYPIPPIIFATSSIAGYLYFSRKSAETNLLLQNFSKFTISTTKQAILASLTLSYLPVLTLRSFLKYFLFRYKGFLFENPKKPSILTKFWGICFKIINKLASPKFETTNAFLPKLPVPKLKDTVNGYLESMKPILPKNEYDQVCKMTDQFLLNEGKKLQLYTKIYSLFVGNYVTPFWEKFVYLGARDPLLINSSVGHIDTFKTPSNCQAQRCAHLIYTAALNMIAFENQNIQPPGQGMVYSGHYRKIFANTRIPGKNIDSWQIQRLSKHIVAYYNGAYYKIEVFDENNRLYSVDELTEIFIDLLNCMNKADNVGLAEAKIAALTHDRRDKWHENRIKFFMNHEKNKETLKIIESSIVFLVLDENEDYEHDPEKPNLIDNFASNMLTGNGQNRWVDKSMNFVVSKNGRIGGTSEHSVGDGAEFNHVMENFLYIDTNFLKYQNDVEKNIRENSQICRKNLKKAQRLEFDVTDEMSNEINRCFNEYQISKDNLDLVVLIFSDFGKGFIKNQKCTPDAFLQMALQLTNYKDQGKFVLTYEATSARFYNNSRTETLRTVTKDSCAFVKSMINKNATKCETINLLRQACKTHYHRNRLAMTGNGIDRHLFVLYVMCKATKTQSNFLEYCVAQKWLLSTSQPPNMTNQLNEDKFVDSSWMGANFGAVAPNGYGICYRFAGNHTICAHITSYKSAENTNSNRFRRLLFETLKEMEELFLDEESRSIA